MRFYALISSPLGPILLETDAQGLTGLYFTDQRDVPEVAGLQAGASVVSDPSAGDLAGRALRTLKLVRRPAGAETAELFAADTGTAAGGQPGDFRLPAAAGAVPMRLLQENTPAAAQAVLEQARHELDEYWRGERQAFQVSLAPHGTVFQKKVWQALLQVPCGETRSYGQLAIAAGLGAGHGRAVGMAVGSNPISIIIPCHRILAGNGTLNGYGGGLQRKIRLLQIEGFRLAS